MPIQRPASTKIHLRGVEGARGTAPGSSHDLSVAAMDREQSGGRRARRRGESYRVRHRGLRGDRLEARLADGDHACPVRGSGLVHRFIEMGRYQLYPGLPRRARARGFSSVCREA